MRQSYPQSIQMQRNYKMQRTTASILRSMLCEYLINCAARRWQPANIAKGCGFLFLLASFCSINTSSLLLDSVCICLVSAICSRLIGSTEYPILLTSWHLVFATIMTQIMARTTTLLDGRKKVKMTGRVYLRAIVPIGLFFSLSLICGNITYLYLSVSFIQMIKVSHKQHTNSLHLLTSYRPSHLLPSSLQGGCLALIQSTLRSLETSLSSLLVLHWHPSANSTSFLQAFSTKLRESLLKLSEFVWLKGC